MKLEKHGMGRIRDLGDQRDRKFKMLEGLALPKSVDLRDQCPPIEDQGQLGSCTSFASGAAIRVARKRQNLPDFVTSHLFLYFNSRSNNQKLVDSGATIRDAIKAASKQGDCPETEWPYDISKFTVRPSAKAYKDALQDRAITYQRVSQSLAAMKNCLAQSLPIVIGFTVYQSFESPEVASTGVVPMPRPDEDVLGGHSVLIVGYRDSDSRFICRNSWGLNWGLRDSSGNGTGYFTMPYTYLEDSDLASDFWAIQAVGK
jgi:C1A family cysteine protease